ncbi:MAG: hypothetical protein CMN76_03935 [Spirochaetaceae bacterium]|nr:hypothetical protein [Spirochaetaceae bacterium]
MSGRFLLPVLIAYLLTSPFCSTPPATGSRENYGIQCEELAELVGNWQDDKGTLCLCTHSTYPLVIEKEGDPLAYFWIVDADEGWSDYQLEIYQTGVFALFTNKRRITPGQNGELVYSYTSDYEGAIKVPPPRTFQRQEAWPLECPFPEPEWSPNAAKR